MKVRKLTATGDYQLGHGNLDFYQDTAEGVAQNVMTRLALWRGQWFLDTTEGTPWLQEILGKYTDPDKVIKSRILNTTGVIAIASYESIIAPDSRQLTVRATIETRYGQAEVMKVLQ